MHIEVRIEVTIIGLLIGSFIFARNFIDAGNVYH